MKQSTKYLLYAAGAYYVLTSGVLVASAAVNRRDQSRQAMDSAVEREKARSRRLVEEKQELSAQIIRRDKAFQNYLEYLEGRLNDFPYNLRTHTNGRISLVKGGGGTRYIIPFYSVYDERQGLLNEQDSLKKWASGISWTY